jgi:acetyl esterase/lipase
MAPRARRAVKCATMMRALLIASLLLCGTARGKSIEPEIDAENSRGDRYPPHPVTFPGGTKGLPGIVYAHPMGSRPLQLDLYLPAKTVPRPATGFPLVVYIHGGGWFTGDTHISRPFVDFPGVLASVAARGYVVAAIQYRLSGEAKFPAQAHDVKTAIRWLRMHAREYGIDPARAVTWGASAGGQLATLAAATCHVAALDPDPSETQVSDCVQGAIAWYAVFDFGTIAEQARKANAKSCDTPDAFEWQYLGCFGSACGPGPIALASPARQVDRGDPPMLLIAGTADALIPYAQTAEMNDALAAAGVRHELLAIPGVDHFFIGKTKAETREANLKALAATLRFIDAIFGR